VRDVARGRGHLIWLGRGIERTQQGTSLDPGAPTLGVDTHTAHRVQVDHQAALWDGKSDDTVSTAADPDLQALLPGQRHSTYDVAGLPAADDHRGVSIDHGVPHRTGLLVPPNAWTQDVGFGHGLAPLPRAVSDLRDSWNSSLIASDQHEGRSDARGTFTFSFLRGHHRSVDTSGAA